MAKLKNYRTTISGTILGVAYLIQTNQDVFTDPNWMTTIPLPIRIANIIMSGGLAFLGISAEDAK